MKKIKFDLKTLQRFGVAFSCVDDVDSQLPYQKAANCRIKNQPTVVSDFC